MQSAGALLAGVINQMVMIKGFWIANQSVLCYNYFVSEGPFLNVSRKRLLQKMKSSKEPIG